MRNQPQGARPLGFVINKKNRSIVQAKKCVVISYMFGRLAVTTTRLASTRNKKNKNKTSNIVTHHDVCKNTPANKTNTWNCFIYNSNLIETFTYRQFQADIAAKNNCQMQQLMFFFVLLIPLGKPTV